MSEPDIKELRNLLEKISSELGLVVEDVSPTLTQLKQILYSIEHKRYADIINRNISINPNVYTRSLHIVLTVSGTFKTLDLGSYESITIDTINNAITENRHKILEYIVEVLASKLGEKVSSILYKINEASRVISECKDMLGDDP